MSTAFSKIKLMVLFLLVMTIVLALVLVLFHRTPLTDAQKPYAGCWRADNGTYVSIYEDGNGDYSAPNTYIEGGKATIENGTLTISFGPLSEEFQITAEPTETDGKWTLGLNGTIYTKQDRYLSTDIDVDID